MLCEIHSVKLLLQFDCDLNRLNNIKSYAVDIDMLADALQMVQDKSEVVFQDNIFCWYYYRYGQIVHKSESVICRKNAFPNPQCVKKHKILRKQ